MDNRAICLPWNKNFVLTPLGQTVFAREYSDIPTPPGTDTETSSMGGGGGGGGKLYKWKSVFGC